MLLKKALLHTLYLSIAVILTGSITVATFFSVVIATVATGTEITIPGLISSSAGTGADLAEAQFQPTSGWWLLAVSITIYASISFTANRARRRRTSEQ